jgi:hypothetical protein
MTTLAEKDPDVAAEYFVDFHDEIVQEALRREDFAVGVVLFYPRDTGYYYEVTVAGRTSQHYPIALPRAAGETLQDGSVTLECKIPSDVTIPQVSSVAWTVPAGLVLDSQRISGTKAFATLSGGSDGVDYDVVCAMTPSSGNDIEQTITIPVRAQ